jgi:hypothetical protein
MKNMIELIDGSLDACTARSADTLRPPNVDGLANSYRSQRIAAASGNGVSY